MLTQFKPYAVAVDGAESNTCCWLCFLLIVAALQPHTAAAGNLQAIFAATTITITTAITITTSAQGCDDGGTRKKITRSTRQGRGTKQLHLI